MKYLVEDENSQIVKEMKASNIIEACEVLTESCETNEDFYATHEGTESESAYNGEYKIFRA